MTELFTAPGATYESLSDNDLVLERMALVEAYNHAETRIHSGDTDPKLYDMLNESESRLLGICAEVDRRGLGGEY